MSDSARKNGRQKQSRRRYDDEFKQQAVQMLLDGHSAQSVADNLGLSSVALLYRWKAKYVGSEGPVAASLDARVRELQDELRRTQRERDVLKKALAIVNRDP